MSEALDTWQEKLEYFQKQEAITADPEQKFALHKKIEEVKAKIAELKAAATHAPLPQSPVLQRKPRIYISYTWHTRGLKQRALRLAEKLWGVGIDVRIDLFHAKSLHGFVPPDSLLGKDSWEVWQDEQIRDADCVLVICTREYFESPPSSGAWRDMDFMQRVLKSNHAKIHKFIPIGFESYETNTPFIPAFIKGTTYYNLKVGACGGFGFDDLVRRLKTEFPHSGANTRQLGENSKFLLDSIMTPSKNERYIVWLHLSDLHHCQQKTGWDAHRVLDPLTRDLKKMETDHGLVPQLLFFTGDGAFGNVSGSTLPEQFDGVHTLLEGARAAFSSAIPHKNVFIVPGNHDVDRYEVTPDQTAWLTAQDRTTAEITGLIQNAGKQWRNYVGRLAAYREFLERRGYGHLLSDPARLIYDQMREFHGLKLGIAGFNSAWSCCRKGEKGQIWLAGDWQSGTLVQNLRNADVRLALTHHPFGWFVEQEDAPLRICFEREFAFHLHGHEHLSWVNKSDDHVRVAAAACYESSWTENGYNFVRLDLETGEGEVWLRRYDAHGGGWTPRVIAGKTDNDGRWRLGQLPCLQAFVGNRPVNP